ncbi:MAG: hypothetical protein JRI87_02955, partial [Deltaproteobacteria bacterium]|nr:hypothetical protein [Deltaproteobacteria bacterium]
VDDEFAVVWRSAGKLRDDCEDPEGYECTNIFHSIDARRVSPDGEILGEITISPAEGPRENVAWKSSPRISHHSFSNEHMVLYTQGPDNCSQCHEGEAVTGNVHPRTCLKCHPIVNYGGCNLVTFHTDKFSPDGTIQSDCLDCHIQCVEGDDMTSTTPGPPYHMDTCLGACHNMSNLHFSPGHRINEQEIYKVRIDSVGDILSGPEILHPTLASASHPEIAFNSVTQQYMVVYNDRYIFSNYYDIIGFILDENANVVKGPFVIGIVGNTTQFLYGIEHNPTDDTYLTSWVDFRHAPGVWYLGPRDVYGALLDGEGNTLADITMMEDCGEEDEGTLQDGPSMVYNPDRNEFLVAWTDDRPSLEGGRGIVARIINAADGTLKGEEFVVADTRGHQTTPRIVYVQKEKRYFMVWQDGRDFTPDPDNRWLGENDLYARWLDGETGLPVGDEIPIFIGEGDQSQATMVYSPRRDRFLIAWWEFNAPNDYDVLPGEVMGSSGPTVGDWAMTQMLPGVGDIRGTIYGAPHPCAAKEIYGEHSKEVELLRYTRDNILKSTSEGQELIKLYYEWSPVILKAMKKNESLKEQVKELIDGVLLLIRGYAE